MLTVEFTVLGIPCLGLNGGPTFSRGSPDDGNAGFQSFQTEQSQAQRKRSTGVSLGRLTERWRTPI